MIDFDLDKIERDCDELITNDLEYLTPVGVNDSFKVKDLITRLRQAEKDAARYRFMRDSGKFKETGLEFDAAVDKAMEILGGIE